MAKKRKMFTLGKNRMEQRPLFGETGADLLRRLRRKELNGEPIENFINE